jgi:hypothetical protein
MSTFRPVTLKRTTNSQIRVQVTEFKGEQRIDIREYRPYDGDEYKPTKHGVTIPIHIAEAFANAVVEASRHLPNKVVQMDNQTRWVIVKRREDAQFHKKNVFDSEQAARAKSPPDGYSIFKVLIKEGTVVKVRRSAKRENGAWIDIE